MKRRALAIGYLAGALCGMTAPAQAFVSFQISSVTASAVVGGTLAAGLTIFATALPSPAFFGKNVVIPVRVTATSGSLDTNGLTVSMMYQLVGPNGGIPLSPPVTAPVAFPPGAVVSNTLNGTAIVPMADLLAIQNGGRMYYIFVARQGGTGVQLGQGVISPAPGSFSTLVSTSSSYWTDITDFLCLPIRPEDRHISIPGLFEHDGETGVTFPQGSISAPGQICFRQENVDGWPGGPGGAKPVLVYTITLIDGASLDQTAQLSLSYATDDRGLVENVQNGQVKNLNLDPNDLAVLWLGPENLPVSAQNWLILGRPTVDTTLHTVTATTSHFSTFALFAPGGTTSGAASSRPATRIIIPNGNPINRKMIFGSDVDEVRIFDIRGRRIRTIRGPSPEWDATDASGKVVESGVYIYQYTSQGDRVSGVVGVAK